MKLFKHIKYYKDVILIKGHNYVMHFDQIISLYGPRKSQIWPYFMLFGSLTETNIGLSLDNFTVSSSEIITYRAIWLLLDISGNSIVHYSSIQLANFFTENAKSSVWKLRR